MKKRELLGEVQTWANSRHLCKIVSFRKVSVNDLMKFIPLNNINNESLNIDFEITKKGD